MSRHLTADPKNAASAVMLAAPPVHRRTADTVGEHILEERQLNPRLTFAFVA